MIPLENGKKEEKQLKMTKVFQYVWNDWNNP